MNIKERIDKLRKKRGWTLSKLASEIGVSDTTVYSWFNDQNFSPSRQTIEDICDVFGLTMAEFYADIDFDQLKAGEAVLLEHFRKLPDWQRQQVTAIVKTFLEYRPS